MKQSYGESQRGTMRRGDGPWRSWKPYTRSAAGYDAGFSSNATRAYNSYHGVSNARPYSETVGSVMQAAGATAMLTGIEFLGLNQGI